MPSSNEIAAILTSGDLDRLVGLEEDEYLEAKGPRPYDLATAGGRLELAKDVSAFANAGGGYLIIGLQHVRMATRNVEQITGLDLVERDAFPADTIFGMINEFVFPRIDGLVVDWVSSQSSPEQGVGCVHVPAQSEEKKPFLMAQVVIEGDKLKQIVFGLATRSGASAVPLTIERLHRHVQNGRADVPVRLSAIEGKIDVLLARAPVGADAPGDTLRERLDDISGDDE